MANVGSLWQDLGASVGALWQNLGFADKSSGDQDADDHYESDDEDEVEEDEESRGHFGFPFSFSFFGGKDHRESDDDEDDEGDEDDEDDEDDEEEDSAESVSSRSRAQNRSSRVIDYKKSKEQRSDASASEKHAVHHEYIVVVRQLADSRAIITHLHNGDSVILNLENIDPKDCGRVIDLLSGAAFALGGNIIKVSRLTYLLAPDTVKVIPPQQTAQTANRYTL